MHGDVLDIQGVRLSGGFAAVAATGDMSSLLGGGIIGSRNILATLLVAAGLSWPFFRGRMA